MLNSTTWLYGAEVLPIALRSKVMGLAAASHFIVNVGSKLTTIKVSATQAIDQSSNILQSPRQVPARLPISKRTITTSSWAAASSSSLSLISTSRKQCITYDEQTQNEVSTKSKTSSETRRKTLEEIAAAFGDKVVVLTDAERSPGIHPVDSVFKTDAEEVEAAYAGAPSRRE